ncbi:MAG: Uncharacterised protein [Flavobacterium sp. SCGC AAA160-P02]|nr:MAG: Uncharacterised protein [Flavobacterium sp. SCGC AAA160-P02]
MKKLFTIGLLIIGMGMSAQVATDGTTASGSQSTAMGGSTTASGSQSTAMGSGTLASGVYSTAMGSQTTASGASSTAMGFQTTASANNSVSIGSWNKSNATGQGTAFVIGNGSGDNARSDAFKVMKNGDATVSKDLFVRGNMSQSSDARLKMNIMSLGGTLAKLLLIDGKSYTTKKDGRQTIGVLAQDIQKVFPELVTTDDNDMLAVNYQGLVPVLINALKEQEAKLQVQDERLARLEAIIADMNK